MERLVINDNWRFMKLPGLRLCDIDETYTLPVKGYDTVQLPHTWYSDEEPYRGLTVYRKIIETDPRKHCFLEFDGADQCCKVFANGELAATHEGGYSRFRAALPRSEKVEVAVFLDNSVNEEVSPCFGDFTVFGGLYRDVKLLRVGDNHFDYLYYGTDGIIVRTSVNDAGDGIVTVEPHVTGSGNIKIAYAVIGADDAELSVRLGGPDEKVSITVERPQLWDGVDSTAMYTVTATLLVDGYAQDEVNVRTGFRKITIDPNEGLSLNGKHLRLRGVARHQDRADVFSAVSADDVREDFAMIRELGANALRLSHYQHPQEAYDAADENGILVWAEIPMLKMTESESLLENAAEQLRELILQNIHHPSVFCWGIQNEIAMFSDMPYMHEGCRKLCDIARKLDPERFTAAANLYTVKASSELNKITDLVGYNVYLGWYYGQMGDYDKYLDRLHKAIPEVPLGISEYGVDANTVLHSEEPVVRDYSEEYQALWHQTVYPILESKTFLWGTFIWNMFDFSSARRNEGGSRFLNAKGLVTRDRRIRKDAFYYYKAKWSKEPFIHICSKRFVRRARESIDVKVYANVPEAELFLNGDCVSTGKSDGNGTILFERVPLRMGSNSVAVRSGTVTDEAVFERVTEPDLTYSLPDTGTGGPVRNWFLSEDDIIREGYFSINDSAGDLTASEKAVAVLRRNIPEIAGQLIDKRAIPLGLTLKSILYRNTKDGELIKRINKELNAIRSI